ncbi:MAG TPA: hypothetical protein DEB39_10220 [Planctomycetaceae bacterium]|nr:hypothetical protein [Planctomycetaceae bacterium]
MLSVSIRVTKAVADEINELADAHGYGDNRSKFIELAARGLITVDRSRVFVQKCPPRLLGDMGRASGKL